MFDNGNFRRKAEEKVWPPPREEQFLEGIWALSQETVMAGAAQKIKLLTFPFSPENGLSPTSTGPSPMLEQLPDWDVWCSRFSWHGRRSLSRPFTLSLPVDVAQRASQPAGFGTYSPSSAVSEWASPMPPPPSISPSPSHSTLGYSGAALSQFNGHFYPGLSSTGILYPREGTEV